MADQINLLPLAGGVVWSTSLLTTQSSLSVTAIPEPGRVLSGGDRFGRGIC